MVPIDIDVYRGFIYLRISNHMFLITIINFVLVASISKMKAKRNEVIAKLAFTFIDSFTHSVIQQISQFTVRDEISMGGNLGRVPHKVCSV